MQAGSVPASVCQGCAGLLTNTLVGLAQGWASLEGHAMCDLNYSGQACSGLQTRACGETQCRGEIIGQNLLD